MINIWKKSTEKQVEKEVEKKIHDWVNEKRLMSKCHYFISRAQRKYFVIFRVVS
jgi:hypothetical protein